MSDYVWEPVEDGELIRCGCGDPDCKNFIARNDNALYVEGDRASVLVYPPDDIRLCRRVPAAGVPVEAILQCLESLVTCWSSNPLMVLPDTTAMEIVADWLITQPQAGQGEE